MSYALRQAEKELDNYLRQNQHLINFQNHLDTSLNEAGSDVEKRFKIFNLYLQDNLIQLKTELIMLKIELDKLAPKKG